MLFTFVGTVFIHQWQTYKGKNQIIDRYHLVPVTGTLKFDQNGYSMAYQYHIRYMMC